MWRRTDEQYTSATFLSPDEHLHQDISVAYGARCYYFNYYWWNILRHPSTIFLICNLVNRHSSSLRSSCEDFYIKTTAQKLYCDRQHFESTSRNCITVNYNSQPLIILLLWHHITIRDYPPIPKHVIKHYNILSIAENWYFFLITNTYPTGIFYHSNALPKLLLKTSNYLTIR